MATSLTKQINMPLAVAGLVLVILGVIAAIYTSSEARILGLLVVETKPYEVYAAPLVIGGIVLMVVSYFVKK